jgi:O-antigen/teichoic acid export membrane protein
VLQEIHRKRVLFSAVACMWGPVAIVVAQIVQVPLFLACWGVDKYGEWLVITGVPMIFGLADMGVAQASASKCTMEAGAQHWAAARNTLQTSRLYTSVVALLLVVVSLGLAVFIDWSAVLHLDGLSRYEASVVFVLVSSYWAVMLQGGFLGVWLKASGQMPTHALIEGSARIMDTAVIAIALCLGWSFIGAAVALLVGAVLLRLLHAYFASRHAMPELSRFGSASGSQLREIFRPSFGFIGLSLTQALTTQGGLQILNQIASQQAVVVFNTTRIFARLIIHIGAIANNAMRPELSRIIGSGRPATAARFTRRITLLSSGIALITFCVFIVFGPALISFWSTGKVMVGHWLIAVVGLHAFINVCWYVPLSALMASNQHTSHAFIYLASAVIAGCAWIVLRNVLPPMIGAATLLTAPEVAMIAIMGVTALRKRTARRNPGDLC